MSELDRLLDIPLPGGDDEGAGLPTPNPVEPEVAQQAPAVGIPADPTEFYEPVVPEDRVPMIPPMQVQPLEDLSVIPIETENDMAFGEFDDLDSGNSSKAPIIALLVFLVVAGVVVLVMFREPITHFMEQRTLKAEKELLEAEQAKQYLALESDVVQTVREIDERMTQLKLDAKTLAVKVEHHIGAPLDHLAKHPDERPKELDEALLESKTIATHWAAVTNAVTREYPPPHLRLALNDIRERIETKTLLSSDRTALTELLDSLEQEERFAQQRFEHLNELVRLMEARRFEDDLQELERSR